MERKNKEVLESKKYFPYQENTKKCEFEEIIERISNRLIDEKSKMIFSKRLMYSLTKDYGYMRKLIIETEEGKKISDYLNDNKHIPIYVYGTGIEGARIVNIFPEKNWCGYIDKYMTGMYCGLPIYSRCEGEHFIVVVSNIMNSQEIKEQLIEEGVGRGMDSKQIFVDVGCYDGYDTRKYLDWINNDEAEVLAFEPDKAYFETCVKNLGHYKNVEIYNKGLSDINELRRFSMETTLCSNFADDGKSTVETVTLDSVTYNKK